MTAAVATDERLYRFAPLDRTGWMLGFGGAQCVALGAAILVAGFLLQAGLPAPFVIAPLVVGAAFCFGSWEGRSVGEWVPVLVRHVAKRALHRERWMAPIPLFTGTSADVNAAPSLPPFLAGIELADAGAVSWCPATRDSGVALVRDRRDRTVSASVPVRGREFSLIERADQERIVQQWGDALAGFCVERGPVVRARVTEWSAPAGVADHESFVADHGADPACSPARRAYDELLAEAGPMAVRHETLVTVTVDPRRVRARKGNDDADATTTDVLLEELRLLTVRLEAAGLAVGAPLSVRDTAEVFRTRLDPRAAGRLATGVASLAQLAGIVSLHTPGPLATAAEWAEVTVDGSCHRTYWIAEWPRLDVGPNWLEPLLLHAGGVRTFAVHYEPVPPSRSQRRIDRDSTRLAADEAQRSRAGFRIGARHRRAQSAVLEREAELVAGYAELEYAGFVVVSASDSETLAKSCAEYEQVAAQAGLELRALEGRHDLGLVCALPIGRGVARRRLA
ncbi:MAG TPA: SCO6880 family protein [Acidimicrobiales bacterium]|nr:SCO6880 family protein [Acidimicrobiales bacterium]